jgi:secondary thiamine-phosphate synthase enzyme
MTITIPTSEKRQVIDITDKVAREVVDKNGYVSVFVTHTTAAITTANLDPGTDLDLLDALNGLLPTVQWRHAHDPSHAPDHLLASIVGPSIVVPVKAGQLQLGTWQRIVLIEFNGAQERQVEVGMIGSSDEEVPSLVL